ncbi:MAG: DNA repair protein RecN [Coriobacteriales bacterium]|jgi:DNA repair protein RecN (Recombination protein N)|nr:DNA repair protein RecN [Coriobacteriales bacterium]
MIDELQVVNYALVTDATLEFSPGCTVLTGETGAGKTVLIGALKLLIGERADTTSISDNADELRVSARLIDSEDKESIASRRLNRQGRSRCAINEEMVVVSTLAERFGPDFDLLGQHEHQSLLSHSAQLEYLDNFGGAPLSKALADYHTAFAAVIAAQEALTALQDQTASDARRLDDARFLIDAVQAVDPQPNEYETLEAELPILRSGEELAHAAESALADLRQEAAAEERLASAVRALEQLQGVDGRLDSIHARLSSLLIELEDLSAELRAYRQSVSFDPQKLEDALDRLGALEGLRKRFGPRMDDVFSARDEALRILDLADNLPERLTAAEQQLVKCQAELRQVADVLTTLRHQAAAELEERLQRSLEELAMGGSSVKFSFSTLDPSAWTTSGPERVQLLYQPSGRSSARPLAKIASGGELSRVMLALKTEVGDGDQKTLVFDEVDAGIGGATAGTVASFIARLAEKNQVIIITHLAQVAVIADRHYLVRRSQEDGQAVGTSVLQVSGSERIREIARMLSGEVNEAALNHAAALLAAAQGEAASNEVAQSETTQDEAASKAAVQGSNAAVQGKDTPEQLSMDQPGESGIKGNS